jgi:WD40 repeat protein
VVYDTMSDSIVARSYVHNDSIRSIFASFSGAYLGLGSADCRATIVHAADLAVRSRLIGHEGVVNAIILSPTDKEAITGSIDHTLRVWDVDTCKCLCILTHHLESVTSLVLCPSGATFLSGSLDKSVVLWSMRPYVPLRVFVCAAPVDALSLATRPGLFKKSSDAACFLLVVPSANKDLWV